MPHPTWVPTSGSVLFRKKNKTGRKHLEPDADISEAVPSIHVHRTLIIAAILLCPDPRGPGIASLAQGPAWGELKILWYNAENLFHPQDDSLPGDDEFTPTGIRNWSEGRYRKKLASVARVIVAAGEGEPPALVGLCEVENRRVLEELADHPILEPYGYGVVHRESPDHRGMDVACLYRANRVEIVHWRDIVSGASAGGEGTRNLLLVEAAWGRDTLDLVLLHLISRYSGEGATALPRREQAGQLARILDSLQVRHPNRLAVTAGDFNAPWEGFSLVPLHRDSTGAGMIRSIPLTGAPGSYKYHGKWSFIDQFLVSGATERYRLEGKVLWLSPLMEPDVTYGGMKPFRTYLGYSYNGGISDHLPLLLSVRRSPRSAGGRR